MALTSRKTPVILRTMTPRGKRGNPKPEGRFAGEYKDHGTSKAADAHGGATHPVRDLLVDVSEVVNNSLEDRPSFRADSVLPAPPIQSSDVRFCPEVWFVCPRLPRRSRAHLAYELARFIRGDVETSLCHQPGEGFGQAQEGRLLHNAARPPSPVLASCFRCRTHIDGTSIAVLSQWFPPGRHFPDADSLGLVFPVGGSISACRGRLR